jgi:hypothetical protein
MKEKIEGILDINGAVWTPPAPKNKRKAIEELSTLIQAERKEAVEEFVYHYWCYNPTTGTTVYPDSVELDVIAGSETEALKIAKKMVKDRGFYKLQTVSNLSQLNKEEEE